MTVFQGSERSLWATFFVACLFSHTAFGQSLQFDIEPDRLDRVLVKFSEQSDIQHLYTDPEISTKPSGGVMGRFSPEEALQQLLAGTDVHYRFTSDATVHIYIPETSETQIATEAAEGNDAGATMSAERAGPPGIPETTSNSPDSASAASLQTMDEIIVTARKREERLQDVPVSVTAISGDFIADAGLTSIRDIADFTPNFSFRESFGRTFDRPVIRGMSNILGGPNTGIFIDGIFVSGSISATELSNVERVEIIKGPQAALYGRATFAGAVNYITRTPTDELQSDITLSVAEYGERELYGSVSGPLVDGQVYYLLSARHYTYDGHYRNEGTGGGRAGGEESSSLSGALFWTPTDRLDITLRAAYSEDDDDHIAFRLQPSQFNNCFPDAPLGYFCGPVQRFDAVELNLDVLPDPGLQRDTSRFSLSADLDVGAVTFTSISSYTRERTRIQRDNDFLDTNNNPLIFLPFLSVEAFRTFDRSNLYDLSQELRVSSDPGQRLRWLTGVYLYRERESGESGSGVNLFETTPTAPRRVTNRAAYGAVEFDLTDQLTASAEIRHARDRIQTESRSTANGEERVVDLSNTFVSTTPRATLRYAFSDSLMAYANVARGNKPGGFNTALQAADILPEERERLGEFQTFDEEK
ncbi:MAG: TonB-dependent receptor, partial [Gammaproteobacteria bacterium]|nr:TonB-dependent receptor [Gammaproteobacteria bacterium]